MNNKRLSLRPDLISLLQGIAEGRVRGATQECNELRQMGLVKRVLVHRYWEWRLTNQGRNILTSIQPS